MSLPTAGGESELGGGGVLSKALPLKVRRLQSKSPGKLQAKLSQKPESGLMGSPRVYRQQPRLMGQLMLSFLLSSLTHHGVAGEGSVSF